MTRDILQKKGDFSEYSTNVRNTSVCFILDCREQGKYYPYLALNILSKCKQKLSGGGIYIDHPHYTHLNAEKIGRDLKTKHNVTIGNNKGGIPTIGDNVFVGVGAVVVGKIRIGNNVQIGANAVVTKDVPDNAVVVGNPAYIIRLNGERVNIKL